MQQATDASTEQFLTTLSDETFKIWYAKSGLTGPRSSLNTVRDAQGDLRALTDAERAFGSVLRAEHRRRFGRS